MTVQIDTITSGKGGLQASGSVAQKLLAGNFNVNSLRVNDVLRKDDWKAMDDTLIEVGRKRLVAVQELQSRGLTFNLPDALGTTLLEWERVSDMEPADISMSGITEGERDIQDFDLQGLPLPIIHKDFQINIRKLRAAAKNGHPLDTAQTAMASTLVAEAIESMVFTGNSLVAGGQTIPGLLTHADRNTGSVTANWDVDTTTGQNKLDDVLAMLDAANTDHMYGPFGLWVPQAAWRNLMLDFKAESDKTHMQRLMEIPDLAFIKPSRDVTAGSIVMHQLSRDVIDEVVGLPPTVVQWDERGGMIMNFKVMAIMIPRVRSTITGQSGIVHYS